MKSTFLVSIVIIILTCCSPSCLGYIITNNARRQLPPATAATIHQQQRHFQKQQIQKQTLVLRLIDPNLIDAATTTVNSADLIQQTTQVATNTFFSSFTSRIVGALVGNLLAGLLFKFIAEQFFQKTQEVKQKVTSTVSRSDISSSAWIKLLFCVMIDLVGDSSFLLPGVGELEDVGWAPISAFILSKFFGSNAVATLEFGKEILPGTDIIPVATLAWLLENVFVDSPLTSVLGLKKEINAEEQQQDKKK